MGITTGWSVDAVALNEASNAGHNNSKDTSFVISDDVVGSECKVIGGWQFMRNKIVRK